MQTFDLHISCPSVLIYQGWVTKRQLTNSIQEREAVDRHEYKLNLLEKIFYTSAFLCFQFLTSETYFNHCSLTCYFMFDQQLYVLLNIKSCGCALSVLKRQYNHDKKKHYVLWELNARSSLCFLNLNVWDMTWKAIKKIKKTQVH